MPSQMPDVAPDQADTYKCFATNDYGRAVVTAALNVIEGKITIIIFVFNSNYTLKKGLKRAC